ncbi:hydroxysqualene dehydroxylase HpnE [Acidocella sp.]|uniref:hydroxysqualene dehydroxylase HpnE n=1 Tax=Acidocella sp. TaxID=50710 RepID=UPI003D095044
MSVHVIGAGLAGLSAACRLAELGHHVVLFEAAPQAGGRARSYFDKQLGCRIDNGNHMLLSGNLSALHYLQRIGARRSLTGPADPAFPFHDLKTGKSWTLRLNAGGFPWWIFSPARRVPGTRFWDYLALKKLLKAKPDDLVNKLAGGGALYANLLEPLAIAALNTMPDKAAAQPLGAVLAETVERGGFAALPRWARIGLSESFVDPALDWLRHRGVEIRLGERVSALRPGQTTVLAVPPWAAKELMPELTVPDAFESICNLHFKAHMPPGAAGFHGLLNGMAEWVFPRDSVISVTISAANRYAHLSHEAIAGQVWMELSRTFDLPPDPPPCRVLWEKRATFACTPAQLARRPGPQSPRRGVVLAGDWTDTGLPATIEGAIRSGEAAVAALLTSD